MHISKDVVRFGPLYAYSAHRFESFYGVMKKYLKKQGLPLQQLVNRLDEEKDNLLAQNKKHFAKEDTIKCVGNHANGPLPQRVVGGQFKSAERANKWYLDCKKRNNCATLKNGDVIIIRNFVRSSRDKTIVVGQKFSVVEDLFLQPLPSSTIGEFKVSHLSRETQFWDVMDIKCNTLRLPLNFPVDGEFAIFELMSD